MTLAEIYTTLERDPPAGPFAALGDPFATMTAMAILTRIVGLPLAAIDLPPPAFSIRFPKSSMPAEAEVQFGREMTKYWSWRRLILDAQMLAKPGQVDIDPWDSIRRIARLTIGKAAANLHNLTAHLPRAVEPSRVDRALVLAIDAGLPAKQRPPFRRGLAIFDALHEHALACATGLLPPMPIGPLPKPSVHQTHAPLPARLQALFEAASPPVRSALPFIWRIGVLAGVFGSDSDPSPDDLVSPPVWTKLTGLTPRDHGFERPSQATYELYLRWTRTWVAPQAAATQRDKIDPVGDTWAALKRHAKRRGISDARINALSVVASLAKVEGLKPSELTSDWFSNALASLPDSRRRAFRSACLLLDELCCDELAQSGLLPSQPTGVERQRDTAKGTKATVLEPQPKKDQCPVEQAWADFFAAGRSSKIEAARLHCLYGLKPRAVAAGRRPADLDHDFALMARDAADHRGAAKIMMAVRLMDDLRSNPLLSPLLPSVPLGPLPDRRRAAGSLPPAIEAELEALLELQGGAASTRRAARVAVRALAESIEAAGLPQATLDGLLRLDPSMVAWGPHAAEALHYCKTLGGLRTFYGLPWTPAWQALQTRIVEAGVSPHDNPVPYLLRYAEGVDPQDLNPSWAAGVDRWLRRPNELSPYGRTDLADTFRANLARLDALHQHKNLGAGAQLPPKFGALIPLTHQPLHFVSECLDQLPRP